MHDHVLGDMTVKLVDVESYKDVQMSGHQAPILSVALDRSANPEFVLSSSCDGSVRVWTIKDGKEVSVLKDVLLKSNDTTTSKTRATVTWSPSGKFFAFPTKSNVQVITRSSWSKKVDLDPDHLDKDEIFTTASWSEDGSFIAAATNKGQVIVWRVKDEKIVASEKNPKGYGVQSLAWNPT